MTDRPVAPGTNGNNVRLTLKDWVALTTVLIILATAIVSVLNWSVTLRIDAIYARMITETDYNARMQVHATAHGALEARMLEMERALRDLMTKRKEPAHE